MKTPVCALPDSQTRLGSELAALQQAYVKTAYVHRFTRQHKPEWAHKPWKDGKPYPVQFDSDADWLAHTRFAVHPSGSLDLSFKDCASSPTWPDNPELRNRTDSGPYATAEDAETAKACGVTVEQLRLDRAKQDKPMPALAY